MQIYVDEFIFGSTVKSLCDKFANLMQGKFEMHMMGQLESFLGLQTRQKDEGIFISQQKYVKDLLKKFNIQECKPLATSMNSSLSLENDKIGQVVDNKLYRSMIGYLLYLTASRLNIMFSVCLCARF